MVVVAKQFIRIWLNFFLKGLKGLIWVSFVNGARNIDGSIIEDFRIGDCEILSIVRGGGRDDLVELISESLDVVLKVWRIGFKNHPKRHILLIYALPSILYVHVAALYTLVSPVYAGFASIATGFAFSIFIEFVYFALSL